MEFFSEIFPENKEFERKIAMKCSFVNAKCEFIQGKIIHIKKTNMCFVEPHTIIVSIKDKKFILIYFDENNLFLYNRRNPITIKQLVKLLKQAKEMLA